MKYEHIIAIETMVDLISWGDRITFEEEWIYCNPCQAYCDSHKKGELN